MADRNQDRGTNRGSYQDRNGNRYGRYENEDRDYRNSSENRDYDRNRDDGGDYFGSSTGRYEQEDDFERGNTYGNYGSRSNREDQDYGRNYSNRRRESDYERGYGSPWGSSTSSNFGSSYRRGYEDENVGRGNYTRNYGDGSRGDYSYSRGQRNYGMYGQEGNRYGSSYNQGRNQSERTPMEEQRRDWGRSGNNESSWYGSDDSGQGREQYRGREGMHRGKGPKGYQRSDERIREDINDRFSDDPYLDASNIEVMIEQGEITLSGTVEDRSEKRRAEDIAESVSGVRNVENRLRVRQSERTPMEEQGSSSGNYRSSTSGMAAGTTSEKNKKQPVTSESK